MSDQYLGEIRAFPLNFAPYGWLDCTGQLLPISQYAALFALLGTQFGGNGTSNFGLPNLQGSMTIGQGSGPGLTPRSVGETGGESAVTLLQTEMPIHSHSVLSDATGSSSAPSANAFAGAGRGKPDAYAAFPLNSVAMNSSAVATVGGGQPHDNMLPYLTVRYCIAVSGIFPQRG
jgi:microcystin-dependent protein